MKIKCPICNEDLDTESLENQKTHLWHSLSSIVQHAEQTFKIHEKIEEIDSKHVFAGSTNDFEYSYGLKVLKSLLENEK